MAHRIIQSPADLDAFVDREWFPVAGYEGQLEITRQGNVRRCRRVVRSRYNSTRVLPTRVMRPFVLNSGYPAVQIKRGSKRKNLLVHRMLAEAFIPNPSGKPCINHIDGNKANFDLSNLEWVTHQENIRHAIATGLMTPPASGPGDQSPAAKLNWEKVREIRASLAAGRTQESLAKRFGITKGAIGFIARNETWRIEQ
jgi:hypothetical protein